MIVDSYTDYRKATKAAQQYRGDSSTVALEELTYTNEGRTWTRISVLAGTLAEINTDLLDYHHSIARTYKGHDTRVYAVEGPNYTGEVVVYLPSTPTE